MKISFYDLINQYPFYKKARDLWMETQVNQIIKGLKKYDEPLTPKHHTAKQLVNHALEEAVDLSHYIVALGEQLEEKDMEIGRLVGASLALQERIDYLEKYEPIGQLKAEPITNGLPGMWIYKPPYADLDD